MRYPREGYYATGSVTLWIGDWGCQTIMMSGIGMMGSGFMGGYWILSALLVIAGVCLVVWAVVRVVRRANHKQAGGMSKDPAIRVLKERYARGEIDREEYLQRLRDLRG